MPSGTWHPSGYAKDTVLHLLDTGFEKYTSDVEKASKDCAAAVRRLVTKGPPEFLEDKTALPLPEGDTHIARVWFQADGKELSARLRAAPEGAAREALWNAQREALAAMEAAEAAGQGSSVHAQQ